MTPTLATVQDVQHQLFHPISKQDKKHYVLLEYFVVKMVFTFSKSPTPAIAW